MRPDYYEDNPPESWEECGNCGGHHPPGFVGDCREDCNRWPSAAAIARLTATNKNVVIVEVVGGVAHVVSVPAGVRVILTDFDSDGETAEFIGPFGKGAE